MPALKRSDKWYVRLTAPWEYIEERIPKMQELIWYVGCMVAYHHGDKAGAPHAHIALKIRGELQKQSVDTALRRVFGLEGKSVYSSKVWDGDHKALAYLYHDKNGRVDNYMGLTDEEVNELRRANDIVQAAVKAAKDKASHKVIDYAIERYDPLWGRWDIAECILRAVAEGRFHDPGDFQLERYVNEIELRCATKETLSDVIHARLSRLKSFQ